MATLFVRLSLDAKEIDKFYSEANSKRKTIDELTTEIVKVYIKTEEDSYKKDRNV